MVLLQHFDEAKGGALSDATDEGPTMTLPPGVKLVAGKFGEACRLGASGAPLTCRVKDLGGSRGVLSMWVQFDRLDGEQTLCTVGGSGDGLELVAKARKLHFRIHEKASKVAHSVKADIGTWKRGEWRHIAAYWEFRSMHVCLDGQVAGTGRLPFTPKFGSASVRIGADSKSLHGLRGAVDEVMLLNTERAVAARRAAVLKK